MVLSQRGLRSLDRPEVKSLRPHVFKAWHTVSVCAHTKRYLTYIPIHSRDASDHKLELEEKQANIYLAPDGSLRSKFVLADNSRFKLSQPDTPTSCCQPGSSGHPLQTGASTPLGAFSELATAPSISLLQYGDDARATERPGVFVPQIDFTQEAGVHMDINNTRICASPAMCTGMYNPTYPPDPHPVTSSADSFGGDPNGVGFPLAAHDHEHLTIAGGYCTPFRTSFGHDMTHVEGNIVNDFSSNPISYQEEVRLQPNRADQIPIPFRTLSADNPTITYAGLYVDSLESLEDFADFEREPLTASSASIDASNDLNGSTLSYLYSDAPGPLVTVPAPVQITDDTQPMNHVLPHAQPEDYTSEESTDTRSHFLHKPDPDLPISTYSSLASWNGK